MISHNSPISGIDVFKDRYVATAGYDNQIILWDAKTKKALTRSCHDHLVNQCRFSSCGRYLITASSDHTARIWSVPSLKLLSVLVGHEDDVEMAVPCPNDRYIATASRDDTIGIYSFDGTLVQRLSGHQDDVNSVDWVSEREVISCSDDGSIRRWNALEGVLIEQVEIGDSQADTVVFAQNGLILAGNDEGKIFALRSGSTQSIDAHEAGIKRLRYDRARRILISSSYDRAIKAWSVPADNSKISLVWQTVAPPEVWVRSLAFADNGKIIFGTFGSTYATFDCTREVWNLDGVEKTHGINAVLHVEHDTYSVGDSGAVKKNGIVVRNVGSLCNFLVHWQGRILTGGQIGELYDVTTGQVVYAHKSPLNCAAAFNSGNKNLLVVGTYTGEGLVFDSDETGRIALQAEAKFHDNAVKSVSCSESFIFSVCATGAAAFHKIAGLQAERIIPHAHKVIANTSTSLPGGKFASCGRDRRLLIWHSAHQEPEEVVTPHTHSVKSLCVSSCGRYVVTGAYNGAIWVYDIDNKSWAQWERPTMAGISCLVSGDQVILASSFDGNIYQVDLPTSPKLRQNTSKNRLDKVPI